MSEYLILGYVSDDGDDDKCCCVNNTQILYYITQLLIFHVSTFQIYIQTI